ncbi:hypothetical protein HGG82_05485 [Marinomonas sp. M1K-6]|uniref:Uncharacterized protein n=1 Tax=Marinomonas profundi TaxID=2726122 RepID=A0A847R4W9_9GAMM|nr:hypothetical protein [Marinomonas profundi]NLQ17076.1 hypothetical protein [Marinomonas profundi]UDV04725.1 hypothetical protein J8N69_08285 [Marinomonas profundi]
MLKKIEALLTYSVMALLLIITGFAIGLLAAALYFIPIYQTKLTFADIGGMLAGVGTMGLLVVALKTASSWKKQLKEQDRTRTIEEYFEARRQLTKIMVELASTEYLDNKDNVDEVVIYQKLDNAYDVFQQKYLKLITAYGADEKHGLQVLNMANKMKLQNRPNMEELYTMRQQMMDQEEKQLVKLYSKH